MLPKVSISLVGNQNLNLKVGDSLDFLSVANAGDNDLADHWMEIQNPEGYWQWSSPPNGWDAGAGWGGGLNVTPGTGNKQSTKEASFTFPRAGVWHVRATTTDVADTTQTNWQVSPTIEINVTVAPGEMTTVTFNEGAPVRVPLGSKLKAGDVELATLDTDGPYEIKMAKTEDGGEGPGPAIIVANVAVMYDSMGFDKGAGNPVDLFSAAASALLKKPVVVVANVSIDGGFLDYILSTPGMLDGCVAKVKAAKAQWVLIRYGHNDSKKGVSTPADVFKANMIKVAQAYIKEGITPILQYPIYIQPGSYGGLWTRTEIELMDSYCDKIDEIVDGKTILIGDTTLWVHFMNHPDQQGDGVHPWRDGVQAMADGDAAGFVYAINPQLMVPDEYGAAYLAEDPRALSSFLCGKSRAEIHPGEADDSDDLATCPISWENRMFDNLGEVGAQPLPPIDGSLNNPGHDMHPQNCSQQVIPHNFGPPVGPTTDPGVGGLNNFTYGLPNKCVDPDDPANANPDPAIRRLNMLDNLQRTCSMGNGYYMRTGGGDYNSDNGAIATFPKDRRNFSGLDRFQGQANYNLCWNFMPVRNEGGFQFEDDNWDKYADLYKRSDPWGAANNVPAKALGSLPRNLVTIADTTFINCQETLAGNAIPMFSTQPGDTSRSIFPIPAEGLATGAFTADEVLVQVVLSTMNELCGALVWDKKQKKAKLKFFAVNGGALPVHSPDYAGLANEGSFKDFVYIDEVVLDLQYADDCTICTNATLKPVDPDPGQINLADPAQRAAYRGTGDIQKDLNDAGRIASFANDGCFIVTSEREGKVRVYSLTDYMLDLWNSWLEPDQTKWEANYAASKNKKFPLGWSGDRAKLAPKLVYSDDIDSPSCMLASGGVTNSHFGDWARDFEKCIVATRSGMAYVINIAPFMDRWKFGWFSSQPVKIYGSFQIGRPGSNITDLKWSRWDQYYWQVASTGVLEPDNQPNPFAQTFFAIARGDNKCYSMVTKWRDSEIKAGVYRTISDKRIKDMTCIAVNTRAPVIAIGDGNGHAVHTIMIGSVGKGKIWDPVRQVDVYKGCQYNPPGTKGFAYVGKLRAMGFVFLLTLKNIN